MRLLCTITAYPPSTGGAQAHLHGLLTHMSGARPEVVAFWDRNRSDWLMGTTLRAPMHALDYCVDGVPVHTLGTSRWDRVAAVPPVVAYYGATEWAARRLAAPLVAKLAPRVATADLVHCVRVGREPLALASADAARRADRPFVFTPLHHPRWGGRRHRVYIRLYRRADHLIALTQAEKRTLVEFGARPDAVSVTGTGPVVAASADAEGFRTRHGIDGPMVLFLGQHFGYKGFQAVLDAATTVWRQAPSTTFVFAGPAVGQSEDSFHDADARVRRLGTVDLQTKSDALAACDVLCVPSTQESFGGVFTEAWTFGRPVIGGDIPAVREVIDDGIDGFVVDQRPDRIAERLLWLIDHPSEADRMGKAGHGKVVERFSWSALARVTESIYGSLA